MIRNLLRLAALVFALSTLWLSHPLLASTPSCGSGAFFTSCTKKCCGSGVMTIYNAIGSGSSCATAKTACSGCMPPGCPTGQSPCGGPTFGVCGS